MAGSTKIIEVLIPPVPEPPSYPCEGVLKSYPYLNDAYKARRAASLKQTGDYNLCGRRAMYKVEGKCFCKVHAGQAALEYLIAMEEDA